MFYMLVHYHEMWCTVMKGLHSGTVYLITVIYLYTVARQIWQVLSAAIVPMAYLTILKISGSGNNLVHEFNIHSPWQQKFWYMLNVLNDSLL